MYFARRYWTYGIHDEDVKRQAIQSADPSKLSKLLSVQSQAIILLR